MGIHHCAHAMQKWRSMHYHTPAQQITSAIAAIKDMFQGLNVRANSRMDYEWAEPVGEGDDSDSVTRDGQPTMAPAIVMGIPVTSGQWRCGGEQGLLPPPAAAHQQQLHGGQQGLLPPPAAAHQQQLHGGQQGLLPPPAAAHQQQLRTSSGAPAAGASSGSGAGLWAYASHVWVDTSRAA
jgi:hypothetical protein